MFLEPPIERTLVSLYDSVMGLIGFEVVVFCSLYYCGPGRIYWPVIYWSSMVYLYMGIRCNNRPFLPGAHATYDAPEDNRPLNYLI